MDRKIYAENEILYLSEYLPDSDDREMYECWKDPETEHGYNHRMEKSFEEFKVRSVRSRFLAVIIRKSDNLPIGTVFLSPENSPPDLAIMIYKPYRESGYGTAAFSLALNYCFEEFGLSEIYAGCYEDNVRSMKMLKKCGFVPHPEGNVSEVSIFDGTSVTQFDFVKVRGAE